MEDRAVIILNLLDRGETYDLDVPLDINASELLEALNTAYNLGIDTNDVTKCYVRTENPIALLHGKKTLKQYGIMNGSIVNISE